MTREIKPSVFFGSILVAMFVTAMLFYAAVAYANPAQFTTPAQTSVATTTPAFMTPGTGTSTVVYDSYQTNGTNQNSAGNVYVTNSTQLLVQFSASSTASTLLMNIEYSQDGIDWYQDTPTNVVAYATTTLPFYLGLVPQYRWTFASSTIGQVIATSTNNRDSRSIAVNVPTRYSRAVFTCAIGGTNCSVWAQFVPTKEIK